MEGRTNRELLKDDLVIKALLSGGYITKDDARRVKKHVDSKPGSAVTYILSEQLVTKDVLGQAIGESYGVAYADLNSNLPSIEQVQKVPEEVAKKYRVVLFSESKGELIFTTDHPQAKGLDEALQQVFPNINKGSLAYSLPEDIDEVLRQYRTSLDTRFSKIVKEGKRVAPDLVDEIVSDALSLRASDIHFEPQLKDVLVRFRVDDVLQEAGRLPSDLYQNVVNRIKVLAHLRTDEHSSAQDGAIRHVYKDKAIDMRVSIAPIVDGEKVALRLLSQYVQDFDLVNLGLSESDQQVLREGSKLPFGMILVTGPTGSGKTTTLYALMKMLNQPEVNITTIEDPVEYKLEGVNHIQVNQQTNLTFAKGLRSIVRQDPNIILVGEIRDEETAEIAVNAALTGHLLLSTFHANDAATAVPRLLDMGVEPFLLASTLEVIVAQRLVRKICETCRVSVQASEFSPLEAKHFSDAKTLYHSKGCNVCNNTGFDGRTAIFEVIRISAGLEDLILKNPSSQEIWQAARKMGAQSLFEDGVQKVKQGVTTLEELMRVAQPASS